MGQSQVFKSIPAEPHYVAEFHLQWVHDLEIVGIDSTETNIDFTYNRFGEYHHLSTIKFHEENGAMIFREILEPNQPNYQDKLSAHKHIATTGTLKVPSDLPIKIMLDDSRLRILGTLEHIDVQMNSGICSFEAQTQNSNIKSQSAKIEILNPTLNVLANSKHGVVVTKWNPQFKVQLTVDTHSGDVYQ